MTNALEQCVAIGLNQAQKLRIKAEVGIGSETSSLTFIQTVSNLKFNIFSENLLLLRSRLCPVRHP